MPRHVAADPLVEAAHHHWAKTLLRIEMTRRRVNYRVLAERLDAMGVHENERNLRNKIARGGFSAGFMLLCLSALGVHKLDLTNLELAD